MAQGNRRYFYTGGFNLVAWACLIIGIIAYIMSYDMGDAVPKQKIFYVCTATGWSMIVTTVLYYAASKIPVLRTYILYFAL